MNERMSMTVQLNEKIKKNNEKFASDNVER